MDSRWRIRSNSTFHRMQFLLRVSSSWQQCPMITFWIAQFNFFAVIHSRLFHLIRSLGRQTWGKVNPRDLHVFPGWEFRTDWKLFLASAAELLPSIEVGLLSLQENTTTTFSCSKSSKKTTEDRRMFVPFVVVLVEVEVVQWCSKFTHFSSEGFSVSFLKCTSAVQKMVKNCSRGLNSLLSQGCTLTWLCNDHHCEDL